MQEENKTEGQEPLYVDDGTVPGVYRVYSFMGMPLAGFAVVMDTTPEEAANFMVLELREDGTGSIDVQGEHAELTYTVDGDSLTMDVDGDALTVQIKDGLIYLPTGEVLTYDRVMTSLATAYCDKGLTATGTQARVGAIAVDPEVIPYGTRMFIVSKDGEYIYGLATAEDCGSKKHIYDTRIDLHFDTYAECRAFGARYCRVYFLS